MSSSATTDSATSTAAPQAAPATTDRGRRLEHQQRAYDLQIAGGLRGAARWTVYGGVAVGLMHHFWPLFRKQTWGLKAFIVSSATMSGLVIGADELLLKYEGKQRATENVIRRQAQVALARRGVIATETEIRRWRAEQDALAAAAAAKEASGRASKQAGAAVDPLDTTVVVDVPAAGPHAAFAVAADAADVDPCNDYLEAVDAGEACESVEAGFVARLAEGRRAPHHHGETAVGAASNEKRKE